MINGLIIAHKGVFLYLFLPHPHPTPQNIETYFPSPHTNSVEAHI
jgi:hypothetical protein